MLIPPCLRLSLPSKNPAMQSSNIVLTTTFISMLTSFLSPVDDTDLNTRLRHVELWTECTRRILEHLGRAVYLNSVYFTWAASAQSLALLEMRAFREQETQTSTSIAMHSPARHIGALSDAAWDEFRPLIQPCWNYLLAFSDWLHTTYSPETHPEVFGIVNDTILLIESAAHVCNIQLLASSDI